MSKHVVLCHNMLYYCVATCCAVSQHIVLYCHMAIALRTNFDAVMELLESTACGVTVPAIAFETFDDTWSLKRQAGADRFARRQREPPMP